METVRYGVLSHPDFVSDSLRRAAIGRFLARLPARVEDRNEIAARYEALLQLSDNELTELGLSHDDIPRVAVLGMDA